MSSTPVRQKFTSIGGQAVLEGVMMRSPHYIAVAVRMPDGRIQIKSHSFESLAERVPLFKKPVLRGVVSLIESLSQGMSALSYSATIAAKEEPGGQELTKTALAISMAISLLMGIGLFVALPHIAAALIVPVSSTGVAAVDRPLFHFVDGIVKVTVLLAYIYGISRMEEIRRVFQYHGAEHKSIYTFESGEALTVENARKPTTLHPRCGTSFLLFLVLISILVFSTVMPLFGLTSMFTNVIANHVAMVLVKTALMLPVAGLAYELIKASACRMDNPFFRLLVMPGLQLQRLTTREPDDSQLEVALASLRQVLWEEKNHDPKTRNHPIERTIKSADEIESAPAQLEEFLEA